jgi:Arylsulfotransferase (ASST)
MSKGLSRRAVLRGAGTLGVGALGLAAAQQTASAASATSPVSGAPQMTVLRNSRRAYQGRIFFTSSNEESGGAAEIAAAADGAPLWSISSDVIDYLDFQLQTYRGRPVLTWWESDESGTATDTITTLSHRPVASVGPSGVFVPDLHEFRITPRNTALITSFVVIPYDLSPVGGPADGKLLDCYCEEVDIATGRVLFRWSAADHVPLTDSFVALPDDASVPYDFFHMNSISITPDGQLLISSRHTSALYKLDRASGAVLWTLGGKSSSFAVAPDALFAYQHDAIYEGFDTIRLFDDGSNGFDTRHPSRVVWVRLDTRRMAASLADSMTIPGVQAFAMGGAQRLPNGNVFVCWGSAARLSEFSPTGEVLFDALLPSPSYRGFKFRIP